MIDENKIRDWLDLAEAASPGPWQPCGAQGGKCPCHLIWSIPEDAVVAVADSAERNLMGEGFSEEQAHKNQHFIAAAREAVPALLAELARLKAASEWRPIEEAPKSQPGSRYGPDILGWSPDDGYGVWHWHATNRRPYWARWRTTTTPDRNHQPTHWMPLPAAPSKEEA